MDRMTVMIGISILLSVLILPLASANPVPWSFLHAGASPEPTSINTNVTFFKEIVKADIDEKAVHLYADYWFRNEGDKNDTIKLLLPLSENPREIDLWVDDSKWDWDESHYYGYKAITFDILIPQFEEVRVTLEFWEDLSIYNNSGVYHYCYSYLVGSARAWNRNIENASFEFRIPIYVIDSGQYDGWDRTMNGTDYVFTKDYSKWLPADNEDFVSLSWEKYKPLPEDEQGENDTNGTILIIVVITLVVLILVVVTALFVLTYRKKREKLNYDHRFIK